MQPKGPFNLLHQNQFFNGWPTLAADPHTIVMAFPVEGWAESAAVTLRQKSDGSLDIEVFGGKDKEKARQQALEALSLDEDGAGWKKAGEQDAFLKELQEKYQYMRPTLFHSPYEATAHFIIGHRISMVQGRNIREAMAQELGDQIKVGNEIFSAFPLPQQLLKLESFKGLNQTKVERLHAVAQAALDGILDRAHLRQLDDKAAMDEIETIPGVGPFFSQGILYRGAGKPDGFTHDDMTCHAIKTAYKFGDEVSKEDVLAVAEKWHPYRMWAVVLLHVWLRETGNFPKRTFSKK
jgi:3-methyladenine DNA glycosylase/8-oxoguanine DNA glycosylase